MPFFNLLRIFFAAIAAYDILLYNEVAMRFSIHQQYSPYLISVNLPFYGSLYNSIS